MQRKAASFTISTAKILTDTNEILHVGLTKLNWMSVVLTAGIFVLLGLFLIFQGSDYILMGAIGLSVAVVVAVSTPLKADLIFDCRTCQVQFAARYLLRMPSVIDSQWNFSQVAAANRQRYGLGQRTNLLMADGNQFMVVFGKKQETERFLHRIDNITRPAALEEAQEARAEVVEAALASESQSRMQRELRSWSIWLLVIGIMQFVAEGGFSTWGALLLLVSAASLYFREAAMFMVFAATVAWAAINNLFSSEGYWVGFALVQVVMVVQIVNQFRQFNKYEKNANGENSVRTRGLFPWLSLIFGAGGLAGLVLLLGLVFLLSFAGVMQEVPPVVGILEPFTVYAGVLAIGTGAGSLVSGFDRKAASISGIITGMLVILIELGLVLFL